MTKPIPKRLWDEFKASLMEIYKSDLPDGAWFQMMEDEAETFLQYHRLKGDANDAVHQFLRSLN